MAQSSPFAHDDQSSDDPFLHRLAQFRKVLDDANNATPIASEELPQAKGDLGALPEVMQAGFYKNQIIDEIYEEPRAASYAAAPYGLPALLENYLQSKSRRLYTHQAEVLDKLRNRHHVALATQTASGKSLAFHLSTFERLIRNPDATALYLYPTKALAHDQFETLKAFQEELEFDVGAAVYDGDTPSKARAEIRASSRLIISNPHGLHLYLGWSEGWRSFLSNLSLVVIDESHTYSGLLGSHVALLLRRLRRLARHFGANPNFLLASGTIANPKEHAYDLLGEEVELVDKDGSYRSGRWYVTWDTTRDPDNTPQAQAALLTRHLLRCKRRVIVFSDSRSQAESIARSASDRAQTVVAYRAGYPAPVRRKIERDVREDRIRGISSTSALEVGIDIGGLDTVICNGYPGSLASLLQRSGRAGRSGRDAVTVLMCGEDPVSRYLSREASRVFRRTPEAVVLNTLNPEILGAHLRCAAAEAPLDPEVAQEYFGSGARWELEQLCASERLTLEPDGYHCATKLPHRGVSFISNFGPSYSVTFHKNGAKSPAHERLSSDQALREAHRGAVFFHQGHAYRVRSVNHDEHTIAAYAEDQRAFTIPQLFRAITPTTQLATTTLRPGVRLSLCELRVTEQIVGYREFSPSHRGETKHTVGSPPLSYPSYGVILEFADVQVVGVDPWTDEPMEAVHGLEHAIVKALPLIALCSSRDLSGLSLRNEGSPSLTLYDRTPGGAGLSQLIYRRFGELIEAGRSVIESCQCPDGCPFCIMDASCKEEELSKGGAMGLASSLRG